MVMTPGDRASYVRERVDRLREINQARRVEMHRTRAIMDGGQAGLKALLSVDSAADLSEVDDKAMRAANLMLSGIERMSHKLGRIPNVRVDAPPTMKGNEDGPRKAAEKRERIAESNDRRNNLEMQLPQVARWLIGYGFAVWTIRELTEDGFRYPVAELRDPYDCWPGEWTVTQQPLEVAFVRRVPANVLKRQYPDSAADIDRAAGKSSGYRPDRGAVILGSAASDSWSSQSGSGLIVAEYHDADGQTVLLHETSTVLDEIQNPISAPGFVIAKRFSFNQLQGQFEHVVGLMAAYVKLSLLAEIWAEDSVFAPTDIIGSPPLSGEYQTGRDAVNIMEPGTSVQRTAQNLPYQMFEQINRIESQLRTTARYSPQEDGNQPGGWTTGAGLKALSEGSTGLEIREYQTVLRHTLQQLDSRLFEYDEKRWPDVTKPMFGRHKGEPFSETYRPSTHINGRYLTRRVYGAMASWDDGRKIVTGLQLMGAGTLSKATFVENIDGIDSPMKELDRVEDERISDTLMGALVQRAQAEGDERALMALIEMLPQGDKRAALEKFFTPQGEEMSEEEMMMAGMAEAQQGPPLPTEPPVASQVLSRLRSSGNIEGGAQTIARG